MLPSEDAILGVVAFHTLLILVGTFGVTLLLKTFPVRSANANQFAWFLILLSGILFFQIPVDLPSRFLSANQTASSDDESAVPFSSNRASSRPVEDVILHDGQETKLADSLGTRDPDASRAEETARLTTKKRPDNAGNDRNTPDLSGDHLGAPDRVVADARDAGSGPDSESSVTSLMSRHAEISSRPGAAPFLANTVPPSENSAADDRMAVSAVAILIWVAGMFGVVILSWWRVWKFRRTLRREHISADSTAYAQCYDEWNSVCREIGIRRVPDLRLTCTVGPGLCSGITRPLLVMPVSLWQKLDTSQRQAVLRHEAAHLVRRDLWRSLLVRLLALPHWFNPCAWLAVRRFDEAAEWACDERAVPSTSDDGCRFAELLVELTVSRSRNHVVVGQSLVTKNALKDRVARLVHAGNQSERAFWQTAVALMIPCLLLTSALFEIRLVAQSPESPHLPVSESGDRPVETPKTETAESQPESRASNPAGVEQAADTTPPEPPDSQPVKIVNPPGTWEEKRYRPPDRFSFFSGFQFTPWYELDENRLWQQIGWSVTLKQLPEDIDTFIKLMQSPQFKDSALALDLGIVTSIGINRLKELPNIEGLRFDSGPSVERHLATIGKLPRLRILSLHGQPVGDSDLAELKTATQLESLNLQGTRVTTGAFATLAHFNGLRTLKLLWLQEPRQRNGRFSGPDDSRSLVALRHLSKLRTLEISSQNVGKFAAFASFPELRTLKFIRSGSRLITEFEIDHLSHLPMLHTLYLPRAPETEHAALFQPYARLRVLWYPAGLAPTEFDVELKKHLPTVTGRRKITRLLSSLEDMTTGNFADTPLVHVMAHLARVHEIQIRIDEATLAEAGVSIDEPISLVVSDVSLASLLDLMLDDLGLVAVPQGDVLTITTGRAGDGKPSSFGVYRRDYEFSGVIPNNETGDQLTESLAVTLRTLVTPEIWANTHPELPSDTSPKGRKVIAEIATAGTTISVTTSAHAHSMIEDFTRQFTQGEHSQFPSNSRRSRNVGISGVASIGLS
jgi:beta-lactamase regulating signal transducer with metallopeptidase domain